MKGTFDKSKVQALDIAIRANLRLIIEVRGSKSLRVRFSTGIVMYLLIVCLQVYPLLLTAIFAAPT